MNKKHEDIMNKLWYDWHGDMGEDTRMVNMSFKKGFEAGIRIIRQEIIEDLVSHLVAPSCKHEFIDIENDAVSGVRMCIHCHELA